MSFLVINRSDILYCIIIPAVLQCGLAVRMMTGWLRRPTATAAGEGSPWQKRSTRELAKLTETAANTAMGKLLRSFWQPVAVSGGLAPKSAKAIRILSEDLTLYRGESGKVYLVGSHCLHRRTMLHTGWIEGDEIR